MARQLTPDEERLLRQMQAQQMGAAPQGGMSSGGYTPGMSPSNVMPNAETRALANQDFSSKEAMIANLMRQGNANQSQGAKGKQVGDIYVAPTWSEVLADTIRGGVGGMQNYMAGKQNQELQGLEDSRANALGEIARYDQGVEDERFGIGVDLKQQGLTQAADAQKETAANNAALLGLKRAEAERDANPSKRKQVPYHDPNDPERTITFNVDDNGNHYKNGEIIPPEFWQTLTPYSAGTAGSVAKINAAADAAAAEEAVKTEDSLLSLDQATKVLLDPELPTFTGNPVDLARYASQYGLPGFEGAQPGALRANSVSLESVAPMLDKLGVNPTDTDLREAFKTVPGTGSQPGTWIDWYENTYAPALSSALNRSNPELHDSVMAEMANTVQKAKKLHLSKKEEENQSEAGWSVTKIED